MILLFYAFKKISSFNINVSCRQLKAQMTTLRATINEKGINELSYYYLIFFIILFLILSILFKMNKLNQCIKIQTQRHC